MHISACLINAFLWRAVLSSYINARHALVYNSSTIDIQILPNPLPYEFPPQDVGETPLLFPMALCGGIEIEEATIDDLQATMSSGALTALELAECYLMRRDQVDDYVK